MQKGVNNKKYDGGVTICDKPLPSMLTIVIVLGDPPPLPLPR